MNPNDPAAYEWPTDSFDRNLGHTVLDPYPGFVQRFICGIDPGDIKPEDLKPSPMVIWQIPEPMTIESRWIADPDILEILFGQPVVPLCNRQIPTKGTE
jgi:hypothetical protein